MVSTGFYPILPDRVGAIEPYVYGLSKKLACTNCVDVFGFGKGEEREGNLHVQTFPYGENVTNLLTKFFGHRLAYQIPFSAYLLESVLRLHKKKPIDILHIHDIHSGFAATINKVALDIPYVCSIHNEVRTTLPIRACDKVLAVSEYIRNFLIEKRKLGKGKVELLHPAIDIEVYNPTKSVEQAKKDLGLQDRSVILFVGRKCPEKGPQILIDALPKIVRYNPNVLAIFVGPDYFFNVPSATYTEFLATKAEKLHVEKNVVFKGFVSNDALRHYYNAADIFVFPSVWQEPFGIGLLEALAFKKPIVASNVGGISDIVTHGNNGLLIPPNDSEALTEAINSLLDNYEYSIKLGENGRKVVMEKFSFEAISENCIRIYSDICY